MKYELIELVLIDPPNGSKRDPYRRIYGPNSGGPPWMRITAELVNGGVLLTILDTDGGSKIRREFYPAPNISAVFLGEELSPVSIPPLTAERKGDR